MSRIYKTAGTTPLERWKNRMQSLALLALGWVFGGIGLALASVTLWHSESASLWLKIAFVVWDMVVLAWIVCMTAEVAHTFRTDWILHKARKR